MSEGSTFHRVEGDLDDLIRLRYQWRVDEVGERGIELEEFEKQFLAWHAVHRESHLGYAATVDGRVVGCAWLFVIDRVPGPGTFIRRAGMLQSVYVEPAHRNFGVGGGLIQLVIDDAKSMGLDYLMVHPSSRSVSFYERAGFGASGSLLELRCS